MSLDKAIAHGKEKRKPYKGSKSCDITCRNNGGCPYCESNRFHKFNKKQKYITEEEISIFIQ
jgi:molybdenum cofactor biosynthesis enzyme MoaA